VFATFRLLKASLTFVDKVMYELIIVRYILRQAGALPENTRQVATVTQTLAFLP
jgi:hypothetical protein